MCDLPWECAAWTMTQKSSNPMMSWRAMTACYFVNKLGCVCVCVWFCYWIKKLAPTDNILRSSLAEKHTTLKWFLTAAEETNGNTCGSVSRRCDTDAAVRPWRGRQYTHRIAPLYSSTTTPGWLSSTAAAAVASASSFSDRYIYV